MFGKFKDLFRSEDLLDEALDTTIKMLEFDYKMYEATRISLRETDKAELPFDIKKTDRKINRYERQVRRHVLTHLAVSGPANLVPGLVLVSIVIDVERIGDYTKNMYELAVDHPKRLSGGPLKEELNQIEATIGENFPKVLKVLANQDKTVGRQVMRNEEDLSTLTDTIVSVMTRGKESKLGISGSVSLALYARYLKRINAHLTNIASSIVNPFPRIGFREKVKKNQ